MWTVRSTVATLPAASRATYDESTRAVGCEFGVNRDASCVAWGTGTGRV